MNSIRRTLSTLALASSLTLLSTQARAAGDHVTLSPLAPFFLSSLTYDLNHGNKKELLAQQALDDVAAYYQTGQLTGILPAVLRTFRAAAPENKKITDIELVDAVAAEAERILGDIAARSPRA